MNHNGSYQQAKRHQGGQDREGIYYSKGQTRIPHSLVMSMSTIISKVPSLSCSHGRHEANWIYANVRFPQLAIFYFRLFKSVSFVLIDLYSQLRQQALPGAEVRIEFHFRGLSLKVWLIFNLSNISVALHLSLFRLRKFLISAQLFFKFLNFFVFFF